MEDTGAVTGIGDRVSVRIGAWVVLGVGAGLSDGVGDGMNAEIVVKSYAEEYSGVGVGLG